MKNILLVVMLFISGLSIAQQLPTDVWGIRNVVRNSDNVQTSVYLSRSSEDLCFDGFTISAPTRFVRIPSSGNNIIGVGTDVNNLTNYTVLGSFAPQPQWGFYIGSGQSRSRANEVARVCVNRVTEIRDVRFSGGDGQEIIAFTYEAITSGRFRVWVEDAANGHTRVRLNGGTLDYYERNGGTVDPISFTVPQRQVGNAYVIKMAATTDLDIPISQETPIIQGTRVISIDSRGVQFITASNNVGADNIWLDRIQREPGAGRNRGRFKEGATRHWSRAGGKIRRYTINFNQPSGGSHDLYTYEAIQINTQREGDSNRWIRQLNGPRIHMTWRQTAAPSKSDVWYNIKWRLELPPGWNQNDISQTQIRLYSAGNDIPWTIGGDQYGGNVADLLSNGAVLTNWRYADNNWEVGVGFHYHGSTYRIKLVDHVSHGGAYPTSGSAYTGGVYNQIGGTPWNYDFYSNRHTTGGHHPGSINFNSGW